MPTKPQTPCRFEGCNNLTSKTYCEEHRHFKPEEFRPNAYRRGYSKKWQRARKVYLIKNPLCVECMKKGKYSSATVVDHIIPHKQDRKLFWDRENWQSLCKRCHDKKTARGE